MKKLSFVSFLLGFLLLWGCAETPPPDPEESLQPEISNNSTEESYDHGTAVASVILEFLPEAEFVPLISNAYAEEKNVLVVDGAKVLPDGTKYIP